MEKKSSQLSDYLNNDNKAPNSVKKPTSLIPMIKKNAYNNKYQNDQIQSKGQQLKRQ